MKSLYWILPNAVPINICNEIIEIGQSIGVEDPTVSIQNVAPAKDLRSSKVSFIEDQRIKDLMYDFADHANKNLFGFNIYENSKHALCQYTEYDSEYNGHYNWHLDMFLNNQNFNTRKISVSLQLSSSEEYEGGDLYFSDGKKIELDPIAKTKGTVILFPSFVLHKVSPVTKGVRKSLVSWIEGPLWR
jgi:PKHD-type hydroxylase